MSTLDGMMMHPRCSIKKRRFKDTKLLKHKCTCSKHRYVLIETYLNFYGLHKKANLSKYQCAQHKLKIDYKT